MKIERPAVKMILDSGGINWTWYIHCTLSNGLVTIDRYYRMHNADNGHPDAQGPGKLLENGRERIVTSIRIGNTCYPVKNPRYVFSYPE